ncbi:MAG TPA: polysaccharide deacetylase family protein [Steroidobacteraceae bacterium]|nr:polysaccharide deacetylase family protein [Steroidobacteraceae bacterium]
MKRLIKSVLQNAAAKVAPMRWRIRSTPELLILMYHRVLPSSHPARATEQAGMYVSPETLAMHMEMLRKYFTFVHLDDWLRDVEAGRSIPKNACAITFDDGWRDNYQYAYPILRQAQAPATIYLVSDLVGTRYSFWPNTLATILTKANSEHWRALPGWLRDLLPVDVRKMSSTEIEDLIGRCKCFTDEQMKSAVEHAADDFGERDLISWEEAREMQASGVIRFGSHTRRHTRLSLVSDFSQLNDEVAQSGVIIREQLGSEVATFCYPNGDMSPDAIRLVSSQYLGAVSTRRGWNTPLSHRYAMSRVGVHDDVSNTPPRFLARLAGVG